MPWCPWVCLLELYIQSNEIAHYNAWHSVMRLWCSTKGRLACAEDSWIQVVSKLAWSINRIKGSHLCAVITVPSVILPGYVSDYETCSYMNIKFSVWLVNTLLSSYFIFWVNDLALELRNKPSVHIVSAHQFCWGYPTHQTYCM
jgi:hypothetical protein